MYACKQQSEGLLDAGEAGLSLSSGQKSHSVPRRHAGHRPVHLCLFDGQLGAGRLFAQLPVHLRLHQPHPVYRPDRAPGGAALPACQRQEHGAAEHPRTALRPDDRPAVGQAGGDRPGLRRDGALAAHHRQPAGAGGANRAGRADHELAGRPASAGRAGYPAVDRPAGGAAHRPVHPVRLVVQPD